VLGFAAVGVVATDRQDALASCAGRDGEPTFPWCVTGVRIMLSTIRRHLARGLADRSAATGRRPRRAVPSGTVQHLERREVLSDVWGLSPLALGAGLAEVRPADVAVPAAGRATDATGLVPMFNGINTAGWFNPYDWGRAIAKDGQILLAGDKKFFLVSKQTYRDFRLEADVLIPPGGNSGLQFRSQYGHNFMVGYQADVDTGNRNWAGGLWYEPARWLARPAHRAPVIPGHWNHYTVEAVGNHIVITVNGKVTIDTYNHLASDGHIALQDHGSPGVYRFKNVEIEVLP
jgi:hypothetical protein